MGTRYWRGVFEYLCRKPRLGRSGWMCVCGFNAMVCVYRSAYDIRQSNGTFGTFFADSQSYGVNDSAPYASACPSRSVYQRSFACVYIGRTCTGRHAKRNFSKDCSTRADAFFFDGVGYGRLTRAITCHASTRVGKRQHTHPLSHAALSLRRRYRVGGSTSARCTLRGTCLGCLQSIYVLSQDEYAYLVVGIWGVCRVFPLTIVCCGA